jgi:hypothetical protein
VGVKKQECVAQSTTEAELISVNEATREAVWLKRMLEELEPCSTSQIEIKCDNQSAIRLTIVGLNTSNSSTSMFAKNN